MNTQAIINGLLQKVTGDKPIVNNALNLFKSGNETDLEQLAKNFCQTTGVNPDEALHNAKRLFGMK